MIRHVHHLTYKAILIFVAFSLMLPAPAFALPLDVAHPRAPSATYTVTSTLDDGSAGTLRWAITQANANTGSDTIGFAIGAVGSQQTIMLTSGLPAITDPIVIDGWSQGGVSYSGVPLIELNGAGSVTGLTLSTGSSTMRGLVLNRFTGNGITISGSNNKLQGSYIGTDVTGTLAQGNGSAGIFISSGSGNIIGTEGDGTNDAAEGNVISGNGYYGINVNGGDGTRISGNLIGTNAAGGSALPNSGAGVILFTSNNLVGSDGNGIGDAAERNVISGNLSHPTPGSCYDQPGDGVTTVMGGNGNHIAGNYIGLDKAGTAAIQNDCEGVSLGSNNNIVGTNSSGDSAAQRNVISNNRIANVRIFYMSGNVIAGNYIGPDATGEAASTAGSWGVYIDNATANRIGTNGDGTNDTDERNIIAGNRYIGVDASGGSGNTIAGNWIGLSASGAPLGNGSTGLSIDNGSSNNTIGTAGTETNPAAMRNVIAANPGFGISIQTGLWAGSDNNVIAGNYIGTNATATTVTGYGNQLGGIQLSGGSNLAGTTIMPCAGNRIGTNSDFQGDAAESNIISGNGWLGGIALSFCDTTTVWGNDIGTDAAHTQNWGNTGGGVSVAGGSNNDIFENYIWYNGASGAQAGIRLNPSAMSTSAGTLFAPALNNTLAENDIAYNSGNGIESSDTENDGINAAPGDGPGDNTIDHNTIHHNGADGILNYGSSPAIYFNTITHHPGSGIRNIVDFRGNTSPATANDDWLSRPIIGNVEGANTLQGNCTGGPANCAGIFSLDTAPANVTSLESDNTIAANNGAPWAGQYWYGTVEVIQGSTPIASSIALSDNTGGVRTLSYSMGPCASLNNTIIQGDQPGLSCDAVTSWPLFTEYEIDGAGVRSDYMPITSTSPAMAVYSFDANAATNPTDTGAGFSGEGTTTGSFSRYQVMQVTVVDQPITGLTAVNDSPTVLGNATNFAASVTGGNNIVYSWDFGDGNTGAGQSPAHTYSAIGYYTAIVTATNSESTLTTTTPVTITELPITGLTASNDSPTVLGNTTNFVASVTGGNNIVYSWDFGDGNTGAGQSPAHTYGALGYYTAIVTATNSESTLTTTTPVTITELPITGLTASNDSPTVLGNATNFAATVTGGNNVVYSWDFGDGNTGSGQYPVHPYGVIGYYTAIVTATNSVNTLVATTPVTITDVPIAGLTAVNDSPTVLGNLTNFTATVTGGNNIVYSWDFGDGNTGSGQYPAHPYGMVGYYTAIVTATNSVNTLVDTTLVTITAGCTSGLVVINTNDSGCGSLRYAVNMAVPGDTVTFTPTLAGQTITLTTGQIAIDRSITIDGVTAPGITVSGNDNDRVFNVYAQSDVTLNALNIVHGWVGEDTGAGIRNAGTLTVSNSLIAYNDGMIGGGIYNAGILTLLNSTLSFNTGWEGSGLYNYGLATVRNDTFNQNQANRFGGGIYNSYNAMLTLNNSTFSANSVVDIEMGQGGGVFNGGSLNIVNSTVYSNTSLVANSGGGLYNDEGGNLSLANTLIAHSGGGDCRNSGTIASNVNNLIEDGSCNAALSGDPLLGSLANNGGPTLTHLPQTGSPVIEAGDNTSAAGLTYDQRGPGFPRIVNGMVDIGAVETAAVAPILTATNDSPTVVGSPTNLTATLSGPLSPPPVFTWDFGDGFTGPGATSAHTYTAAGFYTATVQAANGVFTLTATTRVTITERPLLNLVASNDSPTFLGNTTNFLASVSGNNATFTWSFGDSTTGAGQAPAHVYGAAGFYTAVVTATNRISTLTATTRVTITAPTTRFTTHLPLIMNNSFTAPDLIVQEIIASRAVITVVIKNSGDAPVEDSFWVDAYIAPNPPPTAVNQIWWDQNRSQQGVAWAVIDPLVPIQPGQVITLTSTDLYVSPERTYFTGNLPVGTPIYAQVDSYNFYTDYGAVRERHEFLGLPYNNILGPVYSTASATHPIRALNQSTAAQLANTLPFRPIRP